MRGRAFIRRVWLALVACAVALMTVGSIGDRD